jgi:ferrous iron transport protein B
MQTFTWRFAAVEEGAESTSILASIATPIAFVIAPVIGAVAWQLAAAAITGFIAKENVVGTLAVCFGISNLINVDELVMNEGAAEGVAAAFGLSAAGALAYLMFNLFTPPCFAAIGAMNSEIKSKKWLFGGIGLQLSVGYVLGFLVYFFGTLITEGTLVCENGYESLWMPIVGWGITLAIVAVFAALIYNANKGEKKAAR